MQCMIVSVTSNLMKGCMMTRCNRCYENIGAGYEGNNLDPLVVFYQALHGINAEEEHYCKSCVAEMRCLVQAVTPRPFQVQDILEANVSDKWRVVDTKDTELLTNKSWSKNDLKISQLLKILHREVTQVYVKEGYLVVVSKGGR